MTVLMSSWYYEKKDLKKSPSFVDGIDLERESRYRREGARFIINVGTKMGLRYDTMATGVVYFHRFYMFHSFKTFPRYVTACCCLFLAGKVEETPKKCKDIIKIAKTFLGDSQFAQFGDDPKEEVMTLERILLQTIKFDLQVDHPYGHLLKYAKCLKGDKVKLQNMVQMAWTFINDSLCTTLCLQWEPEVIAIALMYLAGKLSKFEVSDWSGRTSKHSYWWDLFVEGMSLELLEDICHQVLDLYSTPNLNTPQDSPPATPPTKSSRKSSQTSSPVDAATASPVQTKPKEKEVPIGLPIPRLEPGELKRKVSQSVIPKEMNENKIPRSAPISEGKAIPTITTITNCSPKSSSSSQSSDTQPSSPSTPTFSEKCPKSVEDETVIAPDAEFKPTSTSVDQPPYSQNSSFLSNPDSEVMKNVPLVSTHSFSQDPPPAPLPYPPTVPPTTTQYYCPPSVTETQSYSNVQPPPPQVFPQHPFPPIPPVAPSGPPPCPPNITHAPPPPPPPPPPLPQYVEPPPQNQFSTLPPSSVPPFNSQYPSQSQMNIMNNPPPPPIQQPPQMSQPPPGLPPGGLHSLPPCGPPPGAMGRPHLLHEGGHPYPIPRPSIDTFHHDSRVRPPPPDHRMMHDFPPRNHFESEMPPHFGGRREDYDSPYEGGSYDYDDGYGHVPNQFENQVHRPMQMHQPPRHFPMEHQPHRNVDRGGTPQGGPTGIPPVRITGSGAELPMDYCNTRMS